MKLPHSFTSQMESILGKIDSIALLEAIGQEPPTSIRLNPSKTFKLHLPQSVAWCEKGYYLPARIPFTFDPLWHAGCYYVQEASSMFVEQIVKQYIKQPVRCLDLCAAPGGKSTHLASLLPAHSLTVSNEVVKSRMHILSENIQKWGLPFSIVTHNKAKDFASLPHFFDLLLTDMPCSGEGMFRKDENAIQEWSPESVTLCAERQCTIISEVWDTLKPGGLLIYSTCTYNRQENEEVISWICTQLGADPLPLKLSPEWGVSTLSDTLPVYRFFPHKTRGEGFSIALLRKKKDTDLSQETYDRPSKKKKRIEKEIYPATLKEWVKGEQLSYSLQGEKLHAYPSYLEEDIKRLDKRLYLVYTPLPIALKKGNDWIPQTALATSTLLNKEAFNCYDLTWEEAIHYLRREAIILPKQVEKGYVLLTFRDQPIGFAKQLTGRANNLYPIEWKIKSSHLPESPTGLWQE